MKAKINIIYITIGIVLLNELLILFFYNSLPSVIPAQWSIDGTVSRYMSKNTLFFIPLISLAVLAYNKIKDSNKAYGAFITALIILILNIIIIALK